MCGGTKSRVAPQIWAKGLSPRVRGNLEVELRVKTLSGSIPACAGEPSAAGWGCRSLEVYPRVCGGTPPEMTPQMEMQGLSPRVRGNPAGNDAANGNAGSIPACAGEPPSRTWNRSSPSVYPRVCGGTGYTSPPAGAQMGLSPRVRGNPSERASSESIGRSIPTCAGEPPTL